MTTGRFKTLVLGTNLSGTDNGDNTITVDAAAGTFDPADATVWWFPLADADGTLVLDADDAIIPTLIPL